MKNPEEIYNLLKEKFGEAIVELSSSQPVEPFIVVDPLKIDEVCTFLHDDPNLLFDSLMNLSGVDDANGQTQKDESGDKIIGGTLSVYYHLESTSLTHKITLKVSASRENPEINSVESVWKCADWHEREAYDLIGINF